MSKTIGFVFARAGSQGLRKKNIYPFLRKPLVAHSVELLKSITEVDLIFVSSDDKTILKIAEKYNVGIIKRPKYLASNKSSEWSAWRHAIKFVEKKYGQFSTFISIPPTAPLRIKKDVKKGLKKFNQSKCDMCISYTKSLRSPYFNIVTKGKDGSLRIFDKSKKIFNRQEVPDTYDISTLFYIANPKYVLSNSHLFDGKVVGVEIPKSRSIDIDDLQDLRIAEFLKKNKYS